MLANPEGSEVEEHCLCLATLPGRHILSARTFRRASKKTHRAMVPPPIRPTPIPSLRLGSRPVSANPARGLLTVKSSSWQPPELVTLPVRSTSCSTKPYWPGSSFEDSGE